MSTEALNALYRASVAPGATVDSLRDLIRAELQKEAFEGYKRALLAASHKTNNPRKL